MYIIENDAVNCEVGNHFTRDNNNMNFHVPAFAVYAASHTIFTINNISDIELSSMSFSLYVINVN